MTREEITKSMSLQDAIQVFKDTNCYGTMDIAKSVILKALEQKPISNKIRANIEALKNAPPCFDDMFEYKCAVDDVLAIIDQAESEEE